jgi:hypothetical protein
VLGIGSPLIVFARFSIDALLVAGPLDSYDVG